MQYGWEDDVERDAEADARDCWDDDDRMKDTSLRDDRMVLARIAYTGTMETLRKVPDWDNVSQDLRDKLFRVYWWSIDDAETRRLAAYHRERSSRLGCEPWEFPVVTAGETNG